MEFRVAAMLETCGGEMERRYRRDYLLTTAYFGQVLSASNVMTADQVLGIFLRRFVLDYGALWNLNRSDRNPLAHVRFFL